MTQPAVGVDEPRTVPTPVASEGRVVVQAWIASRGLIALVALVLALREGRTLSDMVSNWDVQHFFNLAEGGYRAEPDNILMAFFPGFPSLLALGAGLGIPMVLVGMLISNVCSAAAAAALYRIGGVWAAVAWLFAPTAVFTTVPYTESLFCAAAFWCWERARAGRWWAAALLAAAACTVRVSGLFLIGALLIMILTSRAPGRVMARRAALMLLPAAVMGAFATYLYALTGSWTAWYAAQSTGWVRGFTWPWDSFRNTIPAIVPGAYADHPWWAAVFRGEMISMFVGVGVVVWCVVVTPGDSSGAAPPRHAPRGVLLGRHTTRYDSLVGLAMHAPERRRPSMNLRAQPLVVSARRMRERSAEPRLWGEASWVGVQVLAFSLSYWFFSVNRATLLWFPLWMMLGAWVARRPRTDGRRIGHRALVGVAFAVEIALMIWWSWLFFTGHWAS